VPKANACSPRDTFVPHIGPANPPTQLGRNLALLRSDDSTSASLSKHVADHRERAYAPRGLRRTAAAEWVGMSATKFDELVRDGLMPRGKLVRGCRVWDRYELDLFFDNLPDDDEAATLPRGPANAWSQVR